MDAPDKAIVHMQNLEGIMRRKKSITGYDDFESYFHKIMRETGDCTLLALSGIPGSGKSKTLDTLTENPKILGEKVSPIITYNTGEASTYKGFNHPDISAFHMDADWFFGCLGDDRYTAMLESFDSFCQLYGDEKTAIQVMKYFFEGNTGKIQNVYGKTPVEKSEKAKKGSLLFEKSKHEKKLIVLDGTNAIELADRVKNEINGTKINVIKMLLTPVAERSFMGILKRDIIKAGKDAGTVVEFRLLEFFYIMKRWIVPALFDDETIIFNKTTSGFDFEPSFVGHIMGLIQEKRNKLIQKLDNYEIQEFIYMFSKSLLRYLSDKRYSNDTI